LISGGLLLSKKNEDPLISFIIPTETSISDITLKRMFLLYDKICVPDPNENHLIPKDSIHIKYENAILTPSEFAPYIRTLDYEEQTYQLLEKCSQQINKNILQVVNVDNKNFPYKTLKHAYHHFVSNNEVMHSALTGNAPLPSLNDQVFNEQKKMMRPGIYYGMDASIGNSPSEFSTYPPAIKFSHEDTDRADYMQDIAFSRVGRTLKYLFYISQEKYTYPLFIDEGFPNILQEIYKLSESRENYCLKNDIESKISFVMEKFIFRELIDPYRLSEISFGDIQKIRDKSWQGLQSIRRNLKASIIASIIDLNSASSKEINAFIEIKLIEMLSEYHKAENEYYDDFKALGIAISLKTVSSVGIVQSASSIFHNVFFSPGGWESFIANAVIGVSGVAYKNADKISGIWKKQKAKTRLPLYGLMSNIPNEYKIK